MEIQGQGTNFYEGKIASDYYEGLQKVVEEEPVFKDWLNLAKSIPNISTANVLDAGCGNGKYTRPFRTLTTGQIYGVDISEDMIKMANEQESQLSKAGSDFHCIHYKKVDVTTDICKALEVSEGFFDVVNACWLILHCESVDILNTMVKALGNSLKKGGVVIGMTLSPEMTPEFVKKTQGMGVSVERKDFGVPLYDAELLISKFLDEKGNVLWDTHDHFYKRETYLKAFKDAGFSNLEFIAFEKTKGKDGEFTNDNVFQEGGTLLRATK